MDYGLVYKITNKVNGKVYIGQTVSALKKRWADHCRVKSSVFHKKAWKQVLQIDTSGKVVARHASIGLAAIRRHIAAKSVGVGDSSVYGCCVGQKKTIRGFIWGYA